MTGVLLSFQLFTPVRKGTSVETNRTTSRRTLALIQIWASEQHALLSFVVASLSRLTPVSRRCQAYTRLRERRAFWQVRESIAEIRTNVKHCSAWLWAAGFSSPEDRRGFQARSL